MNSNRDKLPKRKKPPIGENDGWEELLDALGTLAIAAFFALLAYIIYFSGGAFDR